MEVRETSGLQSPLIDNDHETNIEKYCLGLVVAEKKLLMKERSSCDWQCLM